MGVPAFFRWLTVRYPQVVIDALQEEDIEWLQAEFELEQRMKRTDPNEIDVSGEDDFKKAFMDKRIGENNPKVDNLYLDMNGIIHPCCHPIDKPQPKSEVEMFNLIFEYTDKVINIVRPSNTLYLAIDGVAPRAKMNQQRSRRFRTAIDAEEKLQREASIRNKWADEGIKFTGKPSHNEEQVFDSNVITPGTEFMHNLSKALQLYIVERLHSSDRWKNLKVIFSDAFVPGEGEHKILDFIRSQRSQQDYNVNTSHCIYGADADLIMLGLSTHEPHFYILRESVEQDNTQKERPGGRGGRQAEIPEAGRQKKKSGVQFQFCKIPVVREYLYLEFKDLKIPPSLFNFERIVDDFVFLCFLVGNDFLPHLPSLSIREGALDAIIFIYKNLLPSLGGYLTNGKGGLLRSNVDVFFKELSKTEEAFFNQHEKNAKFNEERRKQDEARDKEKMQNEMQRKEMATAEATQEPVRWRNEDKVAAQPDEKKMTAAELEEYVKKQIFSKADLTEEEKQEQAAKKLKAIVDKQLREKGEKQVEAYQDKVRLTEEGWKQRYYREKFHVRGEGELKEFCRNIRQAYIEGLEWVLQYYYNGCQSWYWYYPYHYAPFASDLLGCDKLKIVFDLGEPAKPFEQLLAVFPKQSSHALPSCYHKLYEPTSEIIDFYPTDVKLDVNGARYAWMGVNLLPFLDRERLKKAMNDADGNESKLKPHEKSRNKRTGDIRLFYLKNGKQSQLQSQVIKLKAGEKLQAKFKEQDEIAGPIYHAAQKDLVYGEPLKKNCGALCLNYEACQSIMVHYNHPNYEQHLTSLLPNVTIPRREVEDFAIYHTNRRVFRGEEAIRIAERVLGIDASQDPIYQFGGRTNTRGQDYGGYRNNHSVYREPGGGCQGAPQRMAGYKRNYDQYQQSSGYQNNQYGQKRMNYGQQQQYNTPQIDYNMGRGLPQPQQQQAPPNYQNIGYSQDQRNVLVQAPLTTTQNVVQAFGDHYQNHLRDQAGFSQRGQYQGPQAHHQQNQGYHQNPNYRGRGGGNHQNNNYRGRY